jgi:hypothetical protein
LIFENYILSKSLYYYLTRFDIYQTSASGRKERKAKASERRESTTKAMRRHSKMTKYIYVNVQITLYIQVGPRDMRMVTCKCLLCIVMHISKEMSPSLRPGPTWANATVHPWPRRSHDRAKLQAGAGGGAPPCSL